MFILLIELKYFLILSLKAQFFLSFPIPICLTKLAHKT